MSAATLRACDVDDLDFEKSGGLLPAIVQDADTGAVLMLGYMSHEALVATLERRRVVFFSRRRERLWEKGETSGHFLELEEICMDCDHDALLVVARPAGPVCHRGTATCFGGRAFGAPAQEAFLHQLEHVIGQRILERPERSYTARLAAQGMGRIAQKVGEEGVEAALAGVGGTPGELLNETADLLYHVLVMLRYRGLSIEGVIQELKRRRAASAVREANTSV